MTLPDNLLPPCAHSRMAHPITLYAEDLAGLQRRWTVPYSPRRREALRNLLDKWSSWIGALDFDSLTLEDCVDVSLLHLHLQSQKANLDREQARFAEMEGLLPFAPDFWRILEDHADHRPLDAAAAAALLHACDTQLEALRDDLQRRLEGGERQGVPSPAAACRAARASEALRKELAAWHDFYRGFDPAFVVGELIADHPVRHGRYFCSGAGLNFGGGAAAPWPGAAVLPQFGGHVMPPCGGSGMLDPIFWS